MRRWMLETTDRLAPGLPVRSTLDVMWQFNYDFPGSDIAEKAAANFVSTRLTVLILATTTEGVTLKM